MKHWHESYTDGCIARLDAEVATTLDGTPMPAFPRLYSHDATRQSGWEQGWLSVSEFEIRKAVIAEKAHRLGVTPGVLGRAIIQNYRSNAHG